MIFPYFFMDQLDTLIVMKICNIKIYIRICLLSGMTVVIDAQRAMNIIVTVPN